MPLPAPASRLFTPRSGAFFATGPEGLWRSNDGGDTWLPIGLPEDASSASAVVDSTNHAAVYVGGATGLYRTLDEAASWELVFPEAPTGHLAVSPADPNLVYLAHGGFPKITFLRSRDRGATWEVARDETTGVSGQTIELLMPHPSDPSRVLLSLSSVAPESRDALLESRDQGATWTPWEGGGWFAEYLVGGQGALPGRFYAVTVFWESPPGTRGLSAINSRRRSARLSRIDDDGQTRRTPRQISYEQVAAGVGLAYDPTSPDRVYLGLAGEGVQVSEDGGETWTGLGGPGALSDLVLGIDARNLYAASSEGALFRLRLG